MFHSHSVKWPTEDLTPPLIVTDGDIVRFVAAGVTSIPVTYTEPNATDNSGTAFLVSRSAQPGDSFPLGVTVVEYVFSDPSGNLASANFTVTVITGGAMNSRQMISGRDLSQAFRKLAEKDPMIVYTIQIRWAFVAQL